MEVSSLEEGEIEVDVQRSEYNESCNAGGDNAGQRKHGKPVIFFVSNIPDGCLRDSLLKIFEEHGDVFDSYVAKKKDKSGRKFGFVKYRNVKDEWLLEVNLKNITINKNRLIVFRAKFDRFGNRIEASFSRNIHMLVPEKTWKPQSETSFKTVHQSGGYNQPYLNALLNTEYSPSQKSIVLPSDFIAFSNRHNLALVGRVLDFKILCNIQTLVALTGFNGMGIKYLGGFLELLSFSDSMDTDKFLNLKDTWSKWFSSLDRWVGQSFHYERIA